MAITKDEMAKLSLEQIRQIKVWAGELEYEKAASARADAKAKIDEIAKEAGLSVADLFGFGRSDDAKAKRTYNRKSDAGDGVVKSPVAPKFRHPESESVTYSGRGRKPIWFLDYIANGGKEEDLLINK